MFVFTKSVNEPNSGRFQPFSHQQMKRPSSPTFSSVRDTSKRGLPCLISRLISARLRSIIIIIHADGTDVMLKSHYGFNDDLIGAVYQTTRQRKFSRKSASSNRPPPPIFVRCYLPLVRGMSRNCREADPKRRNEIPDGFFHRIFAKKIIIK